MEGLREHALDGWNIGVPPYGYAAQRMPHPVPLKAAQGRTKTRLILDPVPRRRGGADLHLARRRPARHHAITDRLNADHGTYPPPKGGHVDRAACTRSRKTRSTPGTWCGTAASTHAAARPPPDPPASGSGHPQPTHPPIITRELYDAAQAGRLRPRRRHRGARRARPPAGPPHLRVPLPDPPPRLQAPHGRHHPRRPAIYYMCPHDVDNPRHAAAAPDHPRTVTLREDHLAAVVTQFIEERLTGPDRAALLAAQLPANAADAAARRAAAARPGPGACTGSRPAEDALIRDSKPPTPRPPPAPPPCATAIHERFAELETSAPGPRRARRTHRPARHQPTPDCSTPCPTRPAAWPTCPPPPAQALPGPRHRDHLQARHAPSHLPAIITTSTPDTVAAIIPDATTRSDPPLTPYRGPGPNC